MAGEFHDRDEQLERIKGKLDVYQRRYPVLDIAYEYRIWVLDIRAKADPRIMDYEYAWMQRCEFRGRQAAAASGRPSVEEAFEDAKHLLAGFQRLTAAFRQDSWMTLETARVYAEEFRDSDEEAFGLICSIAIRTMKRFPMVADLHEIREELRAKAVNDAVVREADQDAEARREQAERAARLDEEIAALSDEERSRLREAAEAEVPNGPGVAGFRETLVKIAMRRIHGGNDGAGATA